MTSLISIHDLTVFNSDSYIESFFQIPDVRFVDLCRINGSWGFEIYTSADKIETTQNQAYTIFKSFFRENPESYIIVSEPIEFSVRLCKKEKN